MFAPETATRWEIPARRMISSVFSRIPRVSPMIIPRTRAASSEGRWEVACRACRRRACRADWARPAGPAEATGRTSVARRMIRDPLTTTRPRRCARSPSRTRARSCAASPEARTRTGSEAGSAASSRPTRAGPLTVRARICWPSRAHAGPSPGGAGSAAATTVSSTISPCCSASRTSPSVLPCRCRAGNSSAPARTTTARWAKMLAGQASGDPVSVIAVRASATSTAPPATAAAVPAVIPSTARAHTQVAAGSRRRSARVIRSPGRGSPRGWTARYRRPPAVRPPR